MCYYYIIINLSIYVQHIISINNRNIYVIYYHLEIYYMYTVIITFMHNMLNFYRIRESPHTFIMHYK